MNFSRLLAINETKSVLSKSKYFNVFLVSERTNEVMEISNRHPHCYFFSSKSVYGFKNKIIAKYRDGTFETYRIKLKLKDEAQVNLMISGAFIFGVYTLIF